MQGVVDEPLAPEHVRCLAKVRIKAIFTSSEDWKVLPAMLIQARASTPPLPWICSPKNGGVDLRKMEKPANKYQKLATSA